MQVMDLDDRNMCMSTKYELYIFVFLLLFIGSPVICFPVSRAAEYIPQIRHTVPPPSAYPDLSVAVPHLPLGMGSV